MNQTRKKIHFEFLILLLVFSFFIKTPLQAQYLYESNDPNISLIHEEGNWNASFSFFRNRKFEKGNTSFQTGYSPINNLVLSANFFHTKNKRWSIETDEDIRHGISSGFAVGYYYLFDLNRKKGGLLFDSYLGYNLGNYQFDFSRAGNGKITYHKYYLQIGIHKIMDHLSLSIVSRFGHFNLKKIKLFGRMPIEDFNQLKSMRDQKLYRVQEFSIRASYQFNLFSIYVNLNIFPRINDASFENPSNNYNLGLLFPIKP